MRGSLLVAMSAASSLLALGPAVAQAPAAKPAPKPPATTAKPAAQPAPQPAPKPAAAPPAAATPGAALDIKGFRSATFGMTPAQVKAAITADFGAAAKIQEGTNAAQGTQFVSVALDHLDPGPGSAQIGYVFGATSKTLTMINVLWTTGADPTPEQRGAMVQAGQQLASYFQSGPAPAKASQGIAPVGTNGLMLYTALDKKNAGVLVAVDGVEYHGTSGDKQIASPPPKGPAVLHVAYALNAVAPDVKTPLKPGSF